VDRWLGLWRFKQVPSLNLSNHITALEYNTFSELGAGVPDPDFGAAGVSGVVSGQQFAAPRQIRVGVRYEF